MKRLNCLHPNQTNSKSTNQILDSSKNTEFNTTACTHSQIHQFNSVNSPCFSKNPPKLTDRQLSIKSFKSNNKSAISQQSRFSFLEYQREQQKKYRQEQHKAKQESSNNFEVLERILKEENSNLKKQNEMLVNEIYKLKASNKKYKDVCMNQKIEIQALRQECEAQKTRANEMKDIVMNRLTSLQAKVSHNRNNRLMQQCQSLLEALNLSESNNRQ